MLCNAIPAVVNILLDYTPGIFEGDLSVYGSNKAKLGTTLVKQLALYVTM